MGGLTVTMGAMLFVCLISSTMSSWSLPEQVQLAHANSTLGTLPDFPGYITFPSRSFDGSAPDIAWYNPFAPMTGMKTYYSSSRMITDSKLLTAICDTYSDACQWHNGGAGDGAVGYFALDDSVNTYIKNGTGTVVSSAAGSEYFVVPAHNVYCKKYVGWDLPSDQVIKECDNDSKCDGAIIKTDNSHGDLCQLQGSQGQVAH